ncbi:MAG: short-chain dehydrogenase/reductase [Candidatus Solibacter sp.]|nr:short-chain dehydrogenase/reductase [Candidatus Solibacter sp.]
MKRNLWLIGSGTVAAGVSAAVLLRRGQSIELRGKVVLITGGSRGLGIALARAFAQEGARLALCARSKEELAVAKQDLSERGAEVITIPCDVTDRGQVEHLVEAAVGHYGRLDVLVNNAGVIHVGPIDAMTVEDFEVAMNTMFWGPVYTTLAALPHLRNRRTRIVNITSVGGKVSVPHLIPYSCAKFAAVAFSEGMRAELQGTGVKVVTIAPGLMRTGSHLNAVIKGAEEGEAAWFSLGASLPGISISATDAAAAIVDATRKGSSEKILSAPANLISTLHGLFPGKTADLLGQISRLLPHGKSRTELGSESPILERPWMRALTILGRLAAEQFLQPATRKPRHA